MPFAGLAWILLGPTLFVAAIAVALILGAGGGQSPVVTNVRAWLGSLSWLDYGIGFVGGVVFLLVVFIAGMWPGVMLGGLLGAAAGAAYHFLLIAPSRKRSFGALQAAERFIRDLRIDGADEEGVRMFVARYAGKQMARHLRGPVRLRIALQNPRATQRLILHSPARRRPIRGVTRFAPACRLR